MSSLSLVPSTLDWDGGEMAFAGDGEKGAGVAWQLPSM